MTNKIPFCPALFGKRPLREQHNESYRFPTMKSFNKAKKQEKKKTKQKKNKTFNLHVKH